MRISALAVAACATLLGAPPVDGRRVRVEGRQLFVDGEPFIVKGICYSPGEPADSAHDSALTELRKYATRKGKGSLMSDGISAANSAAF